MSIKNWPDSVKPRERLLKNGAEQLSDAELLAIVFGSGNCQQSVIELAHAALKTFNNLGDLLHAKHREFCQIPGIGTAKFTTLKAAVELYQRSLRTKLEERSVFDNRQATIDYLKGKLAHQEREVFAVLFLDKQLCLIQYEELFYGTIDAAVVHPRIVVQKSLEYNATAIILAHNHPSGNALPSEADIQLTHALKKSLNLMDIQLLDHLIITQTETQYI